MLFLFKKTTIAFWVMMPLITIITTTCILPYPYLNEFGEKAYYYGAWGAYVPAPEYVAAMRNTYVIMLGTIILSFLAIELTARRKSKKLLSILTNDCEPKKFVALYRSSIWGLDKQKNRLWPNSLVARYNYAMGLFECGNVESAISMLEELTKRREIEEKPNANIKSLAYLHLLRFYHVTGNKKVAERIHRIISVIAEDYNSSRQTRFNKLIPDVIRSSNAMNDFYQENYSKVLDFYNEQLNKAKSKYDRARMHSNLAVIYVSLREDSLAAEHINRALELGGRIFSVKSCLTKIEH